MQVAISNCVCEDNSQQLTSRSVEAFSVQLMEVGFIHRAELIPAISQTYTEEEIASFKNSWNHLLLDEYLGSKEKYRSRRICKMYANNGGQEIIHTADCNFFQNSETNKRLGGINRIYSRSEDKFICSPLLEGIIHANLQVINHAVGRRNWLITCHQFRIHCDDNSESLATPEGIHCDGHEFVAQHLIGRHGVDGGESRIYDSSLALLRTQKLTGFLETLMLDDKKVQHDVTPITGRNGVTENMHRDMLVIDFDATI